MKNERSFAPKIKLISEIETNEADTEASYSFYEISLSQKDTYYAAEVRTEVEASFAVLGSDMDISLKLFDLLADSLVTPCTLYDIIFDKYTENQYLS